MLLNDFRQLCIRLLHTQAAVQAATVGAGEVLDLIASRSSDLSEAERRSFERARVRAHGRSCSILSFELAGTGLLFAQV